MWFLGLLLNLSIGSILGGLLGYASSYRRRIPGEPVRPHDGLNQFMMTLLGICGGIVVGFWYWIFVTLGNLV